MIRTFFDSGVLLAAVRSVTSDRERALQILEDANRTFLTSPFVHLELVPKAIYHKKRLGRAFYDEYFAAATWIRDFDKIEAVARAEAAKAGLAAMDALH
ncbi:MAG: nucleic acid-binding protein, partial [Bryobacteraceae bacterium]